MPYGQPICLKVTVAVGQTACPLFLLAIVLGLAGRIDSPPKGEAQMMRCGTLMTALALLVSTGLASAMDADTRKALRSMSPEQLKALKKQARGMSPQQLRALRKQAKGLKGMGGMADLLDMLGGAGMSSQNAQAKYKALLDKTKKELELTDQQAMQLQGVLMAHLMGKRTDTPAVVAARKTLVEARESGDQNATMAAAKQLQKAMAEARASNASKTQLIKAVEPILTEAQIAELLKMVEEFKGNKGNKGQAGDVASLAEMKRDLGLTDEQAKQLQDALAQLAAAKKESKRGVDEARKVLVTARESDDKEATAAAAKELLEAMKASKSSRTLEAEFYGSLRAFMSQEQIKKLREMRKKTGKRPRRKPARR